MGFNTIHRDGDCYLTGFNENNQTKFRYKEVNQNEIRNNPIFLGLRLEEAHLVIRINGRCQISINDWLSLPNGRKYNVTDIAYEHNARPSKLRKDWDRIPGGIVVSLV